VRQARFRHLRTILSSAAEHESSKTEPLSQDTYVDFGIVIYKYSQLFLCEKSANAVIEHAKPAENTLKISLSAWDPKERST
jgi:hypothetical protein